MSTDVQEIIDNEFYSCFISCSSLDYPFAEQLYTDLQKKGIRCWFALQDLKPGDSIRLKIDEAIRTYEKLLVVLSKHSVNSSWVENEVRAAIEKEEKIKQTVLLPISLDDAIMNTSSTWAAYIRRTRHIGDFSQWVNLEFYHRALNLLLYSLSVKSSAPEDFSTLRFRIIEKPLTPQNLVITLTALTELTTKLWLIGKRRLPDLIEYAQTHDVRFADEAGTVLAKVTYNSPFNFDWKVDISASNVAQALGIAIDGIKQKDERLKN